MNQIRWKVGLIICEVLTILLCSACSQKSLPADSSVEEFGNGEFSASDSADIQNTGELEISAQEPLLASELFSDIDEKDWFFDDVQFVLENNLMLGTSDSTFSPEDEATRGMIVTSLWHLEGCPDAAQAGFSDVLENQDYASAVSWASGIGIVSGYGDNTFAPDDFVTREQLATILYRYAEYKHFDVSNQSELDVYIDSDVISQYATGAMSWANAERIMTGISDTELAPKAYALRSQTATILRRFCERYFTDSLANNSGTASSEDVPASSPTANQTDDTNQESGNAPDDEEREDTSKPTPDENTDTDQNAQSPDNTTEIDYGNSPSIIVSNVSNSKCGQDVTVQVSVKNNPGILGMALTISYDDSAMTLESAENGSALAALSLTKSKELQNGCNFLWDGIELEDEDVQDGVILQLVFHIAEDAAEGKYPISFTASEGGTVDNNLNTVGLTMYSGYVTVQQ